MQELASSRLIWVLIATALLSLLHFESARQAYWLAYRRGHFTDGLWLGMLLGPFSLLLSGGWPQLPVPNIANYTRLAELTDSPRRGRFHLAVAVQGTGVVLLYYALAASVARLAIGPPPAWLLPSGLLLAALGALLLRHAHPPFSMLPVIDGEFPDEDAEFVAELRIRRQHECLEATKRSALQGVFWFRLIAVLTLLPSLAVWLFWLIEHQAIYLAGGLGLLATAFLLAWAGQRCIRIRERCDEQRAHLIIANAPTSVHREYFEHFHRVQELQRMQLRLNLHWCMIGCTWPLLLLALLIAVCFVGWRPWQLAGVAVLAIWIAESVVAGRMTGPLYKQADDFESNQQRMRDLESLMEEYEIDRAARLEREEAQETIYLQPDGMFIENRQLTPDQRSLLDKARMSELERERAEALEAGAQEDARVEQETKQRLRRFSAYTYGSGCLLFLLTAAVGIYSEFLAGMVCAAGLLIIIFGIASLLRVRWRRFRSRGCWFSLGATFLFLWIALACKAAEYLLPMRIALGLACLAALLALAYFVECLRRK